MYLLFGPSMAALVVIAVTAPRFTLLLSLSPNCCISAYLVPHRPIFEWEN